MARWLISQKANKQIGAKLARKYESKSCASMRLFVNRKKGVQTISPVLLFHTPIRHSKWYFCFLVGFGLSYQITPKACMESMQSIVWNPLQDGMESSRRKCTFGDAMRLRRYHTRLRVIPYQACGLDKKIRQVSTCRIFWWGEMDSNHRSRWQQIYSLPPLATREPPHIYWSWRLESNPQPADYKSAALPIELRQRIM